MFKCISPDCDCNGSPSAPTTADIGILVSLDPMSLDQAFVDLVYGKTMNYPAIYGNV